MRLTIVLAVLCGLIWLTGPPAQATQQEEGHHVLSKSIGQTSTCIFATADKDWAREGCAVVVQPNPPNYIADQMGQLTATTAGNSRTDIATNGAMTGRVAQGIHLATGSVESASKMEPGAGLPLLC